MGRFKAITVIAVAALVLAGLASWMVYDYIAKKSEEIRTSKGEGIVVAAAEIPAGSKLNVTQVKVMGWPKASVPPGSFTDPRAVVDRINVRPVSPGEPLTEAVLVPRDGAPGSGIMSYIVPDGHRAVTVGVNEVAGVAGFLSPHSKVDIVLTASPPGSSDPNASISKIVLQNVPVLATGQITDQKEGKPVIVPTVTIDLTPEDAEKLVIASSKGSLQMLLRNIRDSALVESKGANISKVMGTVARPVTLASVPRTAAPSRPVAAPVRQSEDRPRPAPAGDTVEVIKGTSRSSMTLR